jgi:hypothetical protein
MKKVLLVCDGSNFSKGAFKMATYLQTLQPMLLTGVFLLEVATLVKELI